ncbi:ferritin-like domain-containing protein [Streptomyces sp. CBMA156]|uniref:ferritin-like domain-containing protein n=1 Tax=Streptomyces sp. CBMA156 TaxID=1930280 RepID=UPI001661D72D|nr:ferritin-like domain-containing protein [Streptomyces sp. CBMA156]
MQPPSRRTFLALGLLTTLTACTGGSTDHPADPTPPRDPDTPARLRAIGAADLLLGAYDTLLTAPGAQTALLRPLRDDTARHRATLAQDLPTSSPSSPSPTGTPATGTPTRSLPTLAELAALERRTAEARLDGLSEVTPPLARLLASIAASNALHAAALGDRTPVTTPDNRDASGPTAAVAAVPSLQAALSAEHAAVYGYGMVGAHLPDDPQRTDARTTHAAHQAQRDAWQRLLTAASAAPTPAAGGYQLPFPVTSPADATKLAIHLETRLTTVYADLAGTISAPYRHHAATALRETTLRAHHWGAPTTPFPGIPT